MSCIPLESAIILLHECFSSICAVKIVHNPSLLSEKHRKKAGYSDSKNVGYQYLDWKMRLLRNSLGLEKVVLQYNI